jgi:hypothetical protein
MDAQKRTCALPGCDRPIFRSNKKYCSLEHKNRAMVRRFRANQPQPKHELYVQRDSVLRGIAMYEAAPSLNQWDAEWLEALRGKLPLINEKIAWMEEQQATKQANEDPVPFDPTERLENGRWPQRCGWIGENGETCGAPLGEWETRFQVYRHPDGDSTYDPHGFEENPQRCREHIRHEEKEESV